MKMEVNDKMMGKRITTVVLFVCLWGISVPGFFSVKELFSELIYGNQCFWSEIHPSPRWPQSGTPCG